jgi:hypothetical protein
VAGFEFYAPYRADDDEPLLRALIAKLQRVGRSYELDVHFEHERRERRYYVRVDGPLPMMQSAVPALANVLPPFAEGANSPGDRRKRIRLAEALARTYWRGVLRMSDMVFDVGRKLRATPSSFLFDTQAHVDAIDDRMWSLSRALVAYENGEVGPPQILEEIHTGLEWIMSEAIGPSTAKGLTYAGMAEHLRRIGTLSDEAAATIIKMKDLRRGAKHHGRPVDRDEVNELLHTCVEACHHLLSVLESRAAED